MVKTWTGLKSIVPYVILRWPFSLNQTNIWWLWFLYNLSKNLDCILAPHPHWFPIILIQIEKKNTIWAPNLAYPTHKPCFKVPLHKLIIAFFYYLLLFWQIVKLDLKSYLIFQISLIKKIEQKWWNYLCIATFTQPTVNIFPDFGCIFDNNGAKNSMKTFGTFYCLSFTRFDPNLLIF